MILEIVSREIVGVTNLYAMKSQYLVARLCLAPIDGERQI